MAQNELIQLNYEPRQPFYRRRIRLLVTVAVVIALVGSVFQCGPAVKRQIKILRAQNRCLAYTASATQAVLSGTLERHTKAPWPQCWNDFTNAASLSPPLGSGAIVFLHERQTPSGKPRLIVVVENPGQWPVFPAHPTAFVFQSAGLVTKPKQLRVTDNSKLFEELTRTMPAGDFVAALWSIKYAIYPGQADPNDPTHFTIRWASPSFRQTTKGVIDGYLQDDDTVKWQSTSVDEPNPPATQPGAH